MEGAEPSLWASESPTPPSCHGSALVLGRTPGGGLVRSHMGSPEGTSLRRRTQGGRGMGGGGRGVGKLAPLFPHTVVFFLAQSHSPRSSQYTSAHNDCYVKLAQ